MNKNKWAIIGVMIVLCSMISGCASDTTTRSDFALDTVVSITLYGTKDESLLSKPFALIKEYDTKLDAFSDDSEIGKINQSAGINAVQVSEDTYELIKNSLAYSEETEGLFDISIGPLVSLWNIGEPEQKEAPEKDVIDSAKMNVDYKKVILNDSDHSVYLEDENMSLNLGAVAKGYISGKVKECLKQEGVDHAVINLGGNVVLLGGKTRFENFSVGVEDPADPDNNTIGTLSLSDNAIVTSGDYQRYFTDSQGKKYHHILDPKTGYPSDTDLHQVTVIAEDAFKCDALSTSLFLMGSQKAEEYLQKHNEVQAIFVTKDQKVLVSNGLKEEFNVNEKNKNTYTISYF